MATMKPLYIKNRVAISSAAVLLVVTLELTFLQQKNSALNP